MNYTDINARTMDRRVESGWEWGRPIPHEIFAAAQEGRWDVVLTPTKPVPHDWFAPCIRNNRLEGAKILGLASGGGQQMPIFAALGAECTVLDYSKRQLESERLVADREGYEIEIVRADMTKRLPFEDSSFDLIFHPVSNCYVEDVQHVWNECYRILRPGGVLLAGMDNGIAFLVGDRPPFVIEYKLPFNPLRNPAHRVHTEDDEIPIYEFSHTLEEQIGGQLKAGFILKDVYEDYDPGTFGEGVPAYWATRALKS